MIAYLSAPRVSRREFPDVPQVVPLPCADTRRAAGGGARMDGRRGSPRFECLEMRYMLTSATWTGGLSGDWNVAANWSTKVAPPASTAVSITTSGATVTLGAGESDSAASLSIAAGVALELPSAHTAANPTTNSLVGGDFETPVVSNNTTPPSSPWWYSGTPGPISRQYAYTGANRWW